MVRTVLRNAVLAPLCATLLAVCLPQAFAQETVGLATSLRPHATQTPPQETTKEVTLNAPIYRNAVLKTEPNGALEVTFSDKSKLSVGPNSTIVVDEYVYGGPAGTSKQVLKYTQGAFRFISGTIPKDQVHIETPTITIGIRGTIVRTLVTEDGTTTVGLDEGMAFVTSKLSGQNLTLTPGEKVTIKPSGDFGTITLGKVEGCD